MTLLEFIRLKPAFKQTNYIAVYGKIIEIEIENGYQKIFYLCNDFVVQSTWCRTRNEWIGFSAFDLDSYLDNFINLDSLING